jgi:hypothetical protein
MQLAALSMRDINDVPGFIAALTGSSRFTWITWLKKLLSANPVKFRIFSRKPHFLSGKPLRRAMPLSGLTQARYCWRHSEIFQVYSLPLKGL